MGSMLLQPPAKNVPPYWRKCQGVGSPCKNYVQCPYWVCLKCWQTFNVAHGDSIQKDQKVHPDVP